MVDPGPNWTAIGAAATAFLVALGALLANAAGLFKVRATASQDREAARAKAATDDAERTIDNIWELVENLRKERAALAAALVESERRCTEQIERLDKRVAGLQAEVAALNRKIAVLQGTFAAPPFSPNVINGEPPAEKAP